MKDDASKRIQLVYWRLLASAFGLSEKNSSLEKVNQALAAKLNLPELLLDANVSIDTLIQRYPKLALDFQQKFPGAESEEQTPSPETLQGDPRVRRALVFSKLLLNVFGPNTQSPVVSAQQYSQWTQDASRFEEAFGFTPGQLRGKRGSNEDGHEGELRESMESLEGDMIKRMALREVLKDNELSKKLSLSMPLIEQLLRDKANLDGDALLNAKRLIRAYVEQLAEVLKLQVQKASKGKFARTVPPKRVFRNLDIKRTIWKNLVNYNQKEERLYVTQLYFKRASQKKMPSRLIVVVDQSGSMVDAMVQSTILASIFAGLPNLEVHLFAFDTRVLDLTEWVKDPFEVLLRTQLGGGTYIYQALVEAEKKIIDPKNTAMVLISDFYEGGSDEVLLNGIKRLKDNGVHFIPVGALTSSGYFSVSAYFEQHLKAMGMPILSGSVDKLLAQLRYLLK